MKIAVPLEGNLVAEHFGHASHFALYEVEGDRIEKTILTPPPHEPGVVPRWLHGLGATYVLAGNIGMRAWHLLEEFGVKVISGVPSEPADEIVKKFLAGKLQTTPRLCRGHGHGQRCGGGVKS